MGVWLGERTKRNEKTGEKKRIPFIPVVYYFEILYFMRASDSDKRFVLCL